jgi:hypothetical protein
MEMFTAAIILLTAITLLETYKISPLPNCSTALCRRNLAFQSQKHFRSIVTGVK